MNLSPFLYELSELIGLQKVLSLVESYGGTELYIPKSVDADHKLALLIGLEAAQALVEAYPCAKLNIALNATGDHKRHAAQRRQRIRELAEEGKSRIEIARELRTTDRTVRKVLGEEVDDRQRALFEL